MIRRRRRRRRGAFGVVFAVLAAAALAVVWLSAGGPLNGDASSAPTATASADGVPGRPVDAFEIMVVRVIDGDTIKARPVARNEIMPDAAAVSVRLIGIDTPETYPDEECWGTEGTHALRLLAHEGTTLWASADAEWYDRYDRVLLYLWTSDGRFINHELVADGDAEALLVEPNDEYATLFASDESTARAAGEGQWGACF